MFLQPTSAGPPPPTLDSDVPTDGLAADPATLARAADGLAALPGDPFSPVLDRTLLTDPILGDPTLAQALRDFTDLWEHCLSALADHGTALEDHLRQNAEGYQQADTAAACALTHARCTAASTRAG